MGLIIDVHIDVHSHLCYTVFVLSMHRLENNLYLPGKALQLWRLWSKCNILSKVGSNKARLANDRLLENTVEHCGPYIVNQKPEDAKNMPTDVRQAILLLVTDLYEGRLPNSNDAQNLTKRAEIILQRHKKINII